MITREYEVFDLKPEHMQDVLKICRQELGSDYHSEADFKRCLEKGSGHFCNVILDDLGAVCGFAAAMIVNPESASEYLKLPASGERDRILSLNKIGILDSGAIESARQKEGLGRLLVHASSKRLVHEEADVICSMAWKTIHGVTNAKKLLKEMGLEESLEIDGYWNLVVDSPEGHHCPVCGKPPCRCQGVLYVRYVTKE